VSSGTGIRVDRILVAELLPVLRGYTIKLRYTYRIHGKPHTYKSEFKFDCIARGKKLVWAHRDECKFHGDDSKRSYT